jgi:hypothetical protein
MTTRGDFDRHLAAWFEASAPSSEPEPLLGQVLARTARTRRRPAWRIPERWIPMSAITTRSAKVSQIPWRIVGLIALLAVALIGGALLIAGTRRPPLPPPFGAAGDGKLVYSVDGDIFVRESPTATNSALLTGATIDEVPVMSYDGSRFVFTRHTSGSLAGLWIANADGSAQQRLDLPFSTISWIDWAPTGTDLYVANENGQRSMAIVPTDGSPSTTLDLGVPVQVPSHRPGHDDQILFKGQGVSGDWGFYLVGRDGVDPQRLDLDPGFQSDTDYRTHRDEYFSGAAWASDGRRLLYYTLEPAPTSAAGPGFRIHLAEIGPAGEVLSDRILESDPSHDDEFNASWLPTEDSILFQIVEGNRHTLAIASLRDALGPARDLGVHGADWISSIIAPDGQSVIVAVPAVPGGRQSMSIVDLASLTDTPLAVEPDVTWQRVAR